MKKAIVGSIVTLAALATFGAPASAFSPNPNPGYLHNCVGGTTSYVTMDNPLPAPFNSAQGIGNVATANGSTANGVMDYIKVVVCG